VAFTTQRENAFLTEKETSNMLEASRKSRNKNFYYYVLTLLPFLVVVLLFFVGAKIIRHNSPGGLQLKSILDKSDVINLFLKYLLPIDSTTMWYY